MLANIEKRNVFLRYIIGKIVAEDSDFPLRQEMLDFFIECTGGKAYKYRSFDKKGYAISNLISGTLHCSPPSSFNDPFDCKIGLDIQSLLISKCGLQKERIFTIFQKFLLVYKGVANINDCTPPEKAVIEHWLGSNAIRNLLSDEVHFYTEQDLFAYIFRNPDVVTDFLCGAVTDSAVSKALNASRKSVSSVVANIVTNAQIQFSEKISFSDIAKFNGITADADEISLAAILIGSLDPEKYEDVLKIQAAYEQLEIRLEEDFEKLFLVGCLADDYRNRLMWSHYADEHKGFCLEYDYSTGEQLSTVPFPVAYTAERVKMPWEAFLETSTEKKAFATNVMMQALLSKDDAWAYESEWRILIRNTENANLKMPRISCIYVGALCEEKHREELKEIAARLRIPIKQMVIDRGEYALHATEMK